MTSAPALRQELAAFLRSRRERLRPEDVGLPASGRRRTAGLRREEVAQLAGIGVTWYTWLEQGRDVRPSTNVAAALADALNLSQAERAHLHALLHRDEAAEPVVTAAPLQMLCNEIRSPAYVRDSAGDLLGWNAAAARFFGDFGPIWNGSPNLLIYMFLNDGARWTLKDWPDVAARAVAQFRRVNGGCAPGTRAAAVADHLKASSSEFRTMWNTFVVTDFYVGQRTLRDRSGNEITFSYATLASPNVPSPWITIYVPVSAEAQTTSEATAADPHAGKPPQGTSRKRR